MLSELLLFLNMKQPYTVDYIKSELYTAGSWRIADIQRNSDSESTRSLISLLSPISTQNFNPIRFCWDLSCWNSKSIYSSSISKWKNLVRVNRFWVSATQIPTESDRVEILGGDGREEGDERSSWFTVGISLYISNSSTSSRIQFRFYVTDCIWLFHIQKEQYFFWGVTFFLQQVSFVATGVFFFAHQCIESVLTLT